MARSVIGPSGRKLRACDHRRCDMDILTRPLLAVLLAVLVACSSSAGASAPAAPAPAQPSSPASAAPASPASSSSAGGGPITSPDEAARLVLALDPHFEEPGPDRWLLLLRGDDDRGRTPGQRGARLGRLSRRLHQSPPLDLLGRARRHDDAPVRDRRAGSLGLPRRRRIDVLDPSPPDGAAETKEPRPRRARLHESCDRGGRSQRGCAPRPGSDEKASG